MSKVIARLNADQKYRTEISTRGHTWIADEPEDSGGDNTGPTPVETLLGALGACVAITLKLYAERKGWNLTGVETSVDYQKLKAAEYSAYQGEAPFVNHLSQQIVLHGDLTTDQRERLMEIAEKCPVARIIAGPSFVVKELLEGEALPE